MAEERAASALTRIGGTGILALGLSLVLAGCVAIPSYPLAREAKLYGHPGQLGGAVCLEVELQRFLNGKPSEHFLAGQRAEWVASVMDAYRRSGVFDRIVAWNEPHDLDIQVLVRDYGTMNRPWAVVSLLTAFVLPAVGHTRMELETIVRAPGVPVPLADSTTSFEYRNVVHISMLPLLPTNADTWVEREAVYGMARRGLAQVVTELPLRVGPGTAGVHARSRWKPDGAAEEFSNAQTQQQTRHREPPQSLVSTASLRPARGGARGSTR